MNSELKPKIRFKGFTDDWEQRNFSEIVDKAVDNRGKTPPVLKEGEHPLIEVACLGYGTPDYSKVTKYLDDNTFKTALRDYIKKDDILFSTVGSIGLVSLMDSREKAAIAQNIVSFRAKKNYDAKYLYSLFSNGNNQDKALRIVMNGVQPSVKVSQLNNVEYIVASNISEQINIGKLFNYIDNFITLHQRKCDKLVELKKSLLEKMFPQNNSVIPEIRFKGFNDDWEQRKFDSLAKVDRGLTYSPTDLNNNGIRVLRSSNIEEDQFQIFDDDVFVNPSCVNIEFANNNDILITSANGSSRLVGKHTIISGLSSNTTVHGGFMLLARPYINSYFLNASMSSNWYKKFIDLYVAGGNGAIGNLSKSDLDNQIINIPNDKEILKIGDLFRILDNLITLHQRKHNKLNKIKQSLLNDMFV